MSRLEPLKFQPSLREKVWGTHHLELLGGRSERRIGEAWCLHDGSRVAVGDLAGRSVASLVRKFGDRLMGPHWHPALFHRPDGPGACLGMRRDSFPIVGKLLFGAGRLSIQVHPDNASASRLEGGVGKTELWYVLDAAPEARLGLGTLENLKGPRLAAVAADGSIEGRLRWVPARAGQCVLVQAGTVHSIRGGVALCEIQQNSDITYRLFDYGQSGLDGQRRRLQVERAVEAADTGLRPVPQELRLRATAPCRVAHVGACPYFTADLLSWSGPFLYTPDPRRCQMILIVRGYGSLNNVGFDVGDAFLIPAEAARFPANGWKVQAVRAYLP